MSTNLHHAPHARSRSRARRGGRVLVAVTAALGVVVASAVVASAHVRVIPGDPAASAWTTLTFRVPTESDTASTTRLEVALPTATPLLSVSTKPVPGWTATVEAATLPEPVEVGGATITTAPATVTWVADDDAAIAPGQFQEFEISAGPLPAEGTVFSFPATQTYSDGTVVEWDEVATEGEQEPERPAPGFTVTAASGEAPAADEASGADPLARALGGAGLALGLVAVGIAVLGRRRGTAPATDAA